MPSTHDDARAKVRRRGLPRGLFIVITIPFLVWLVLPWPIPLRWKDPATTAYIEQRIRQAGAAGAPFELRHEWIPLDEIPADLVRAVLVAEDDRFREHGGIDWEAIAEEVRYRGPIPPDPRRAEDRAALAEAWRHMRENRDEVRGRSTLTQQLARNLYLSESRSFVRKAQEFVIARRLEFFLPKDRILELYLNVAELGPGIFGVEAAAQTYFERSAREVTRFQAASLAATLPHPLTSNPATSPGRMAWRRDLILNRLGGGSIPIPPAPEDIRIPDIVIPDLPVPDVPIPDTLVQDTIARDTIRRDTLDADTLVFDTLTAEARPPSIDPREAGGSR